MYWRYLFLRRFRDFNSLADVISWICQGLKVQLFLKTREPRVGRTKLFQAGPVLPILSGKFLKKFVCGIMTNMRCRL